MKSLWSDASAAEATGGEVRGHFHASRVEIDSRKIQLGDLFVAIKGERVDGHLYVADALARGAVAAVVSSVPEGLPRGAALVIVPDTLEALVGLGKYARARSKAQIVGITGSVGKTSTKDMMKIALAAHGKTYATTGNYNNHIGTPLNLANLPEDAKFGVFEMGMNHAGEIAYLTKMVRPHVAVITTVDAVHLEFFASLEKIADAKAEIFEGLEENGAAVINEDNAFASYLKGKAKASAIAHCASFGESPKADARMISYKATTGAAQIEAVIAGEKHSYKLAATGKHLAVNSLAVLGACHALSLNVGKSAAALAAFGEGDGRGRITTLALAGGAAQLMDDSYNASPASMRAAFAKLNEYWELSGRKGRKIAALGDMLELGSDAPSMHAALSDALIAEGIHQIFTAGALMKHLQAALPKEIRATHVQEAKQLLPLIEKSLKPGDILLIKGSHGSKMYEVAAALSTSSSRKEKHAV